MPITRVAEAVHHVVISNAVERFTFSLGQWGGQLTELEFVWLAADDIPDRAGWQTDHRLNMYRHRRGVYSRLNQGHETTGTLERALRWLTAEVEARGIDASPDHPI